jgi:hypothetical protein
MATTVIMELPKDLRPRIFPCCHVSSLPGVKLPIVACGNCVAKLSRTMKRNPPNEMSEAKNPKVPGHSLVPSIVFVALCYTLAKKAYCLQVCAV